MLEASAMIPPREMPDLRGRRPGLRQPRCPGRHHR